MTEQEGKKSPTLRSWLLASALLVIAAIALVSMAAVAYYPSIIMLLGFGVGAAGIFATKQPFFWQENRFNITSRLIIASVLVLLFLAIGAGIYVVPIKEASSNPVASLTEKQQKQFEEDWKNSQEQQAQETEEKADFDDTVIENTNEETKPSMTAAAAKSYAQRLYYELIEKGENAFSSRQNQ